MALARHPGPAPDDLAAALDDALQPFFMMGARAASAALHRISSTQLQALLVLERHEPLSIGALGELLGAIPSSVTRLAHRLVAADLVERRPDHTDRRVVALALTSSGRRLVQEVRAARRAELAEALPALTEAGQRRLLDALQALGERLDRAEAEDVPQGWLHNGKD